MGRFLKSIEVSFELKDPSVVYTQSLPDRVSSLNRAVEHRDLCIRPRQQITAHIHQNVGVAGIGKLVRSVVPQARPLGLSPRADCGREQSVIVRSALFQQRLKLFREGLRLGSIRHETRRAVDVLVPVGGPDSVLRTWTRRPGEHLLVE